MQDLSKIESDPQPTVPPRGPLICVLEDTLSMVEDELKKGKTEEEQGDSSKNTDEIQS